MVSMKSFYTGQGDDGYTQLLGKGRVPKHHPRPEAYGTLDEASAALGLSRALANSAETKEVVARIQRELSALMAEVAAIPEEAASFRVIAEEHVDWLEEQTGSFQERVAMPAGFVIGGDSIGGAALDYARTVVRRAERRVAELLHREELENEQLLRYLNRLSSLCFVLALWENQASGVQAPSLVKPEPE